MHQDPNAPMGSKKFTAIAVAAVVFCGAMAYIGVRMTGCSQQRNPASIGVESSLSTLCASNNFDDATKQLADRTITKENINDSFMMIGSNPASSTCLKAAIMHGNVDFVAYLLSKDAQVFDSEYTLMIDHLFVFRDNNAVDAVAQYQANAQKNGMDVSSSQAIAAKMLNLITPKYIHAISMTTSPNINIDVGVNSNGSSILSIAARYGASPSVKELIAAKADVNHADLSGTQVVTEAMTSGHQAIVDVLASAGAKSKRADAVKSGGPGPASVNEISEKETADGATTPANSNNQ